MRKGNPLTAMAAMSAVLWVGLSSRVTMLKDDISNYCKGFGPAVLDGSAYYPVGGNYRSDARAKAKRRNVEQMRRQARNRRGE